MNKKTQQLGMNPSTATYRLLRDLLFDNVKDTPCFRCGEKMTRDTFSIEHKKNWMDSDDPVGNYFDLNNISYSHQSCNSRHHSKFGTSKKGDALAEHVKVYNKEYKLRFTEEERKIKRREQYLRTGK